MNSHDLHRSFAPWVSSPDRILFPFMIEFCFLSGTRSADILLDDIDNIRLAHASTECESTERALSATGDCDPIFLSNGELLCRARTIC